MRASKNVSWRTLRIFLGALIMRVWLCGLAAGALLNVVAYGLLTWTIEGLLPGPCRPWHLKIMLFDGSLWLLARLHAPVQLPRCIAMTPLSLLGRGIWPRSPDGAANLVVEKACWGWHSFAWTWPSPSTS